MTELHGRLTDSEKEVVLQWIKERWPGGHCPVCNHTDFSIEPYIGELPTSLRGPSYIFPFVLALCNNCAHTVLLNAVSIGLYPEVKDADATS